METYIISCDMAWGGDYNALHKAIQHYEVCAHIAESTWAVLTEDSAQMIANHLSGYLPAGSRLFVVRSGDEAAWQNVKCSHKRLQDILSQDVLTT